MSARLRLVRGDDGRVFLDRWGWEWPEPKEGEENRSLVGIFLHKMEAPDPGVDLHDHPWAFLSLILWGGYTEERADVRHASLYSCIAEASPTTCRRGFQHRHGVGSIHLVRLDECHRITHLNWPTSWQLVIHGPNRRLWGFYLPTGWMFWKKYEETVRRERRDAHVEISSNDPVGTRP